MGHFEFGTAALFLVGLVLLPESSFGHNLTTDEKILAYTFPPEFEEKFPYYLSGHDDEGSPVWIFEYGKWDVRSAVEKGGVWLHHLDVWFDQMFITFRDSAGKSDVKDVIILVDLEGWDLRQAGNLATVSLMLNKFSAGQKYLTPDKMKRILLVNANYLFDTLYERGKHLIGALSQKVDVYGTNKDKWIPKLLRLVPKDQLPEWYGGSEDWSPIIVKG